MSNAAPIHAIANSTMIIVSASLNIWGDSAGEIGVYDGGSPLLDLLARVTIIREVGELDGARFEARKLPGTAYHALHFVEL
jgi:hypothetical protein